MPILAVVISVVICIVIIIIIDLFIIIVFIIWPYRWSDWSADGQRYTLVQPMVNVSLW